MKSAFGLRTIASGICIVAALASVTVCNPSAYAQDAEWIWAPSTRSSQSPAGMAYFRRTLQLHGVDNGEIRIACDEQYTLYVNGVRLGSGDDWSHLDVYDVGPYLTNGSNLIAVEAEKSKPGPAGLVMEARFQEQHGASLRYSTNASWGVSTRRQRGWQTPGFNDSRWAKARSLGKIGATDPWTSLTSGHQSGKRARFEVARGFRVEWVVKPDDAKSLLAMSFDEFGNILASRENGPLLIAFTSKDKKPEVQVKIYCKEITNCQGILAMNGDVYATADGPEGAALYRLKDHDRDGAADSVEAILKFKGKMKEHGPHGLRLGPDGLIYMVCGNETQLVDPPLASSPYHFIYEGDVVQPRYEDPRGHARNVKAPGGTILRIATDGSFVERFAGGLRNPYDIVFDRHGELFTWDADMEWDQGTTWYRPTRVNHITAGAEFGWRSGWAKWPSYFSDSLPSVFDTGHGSPTGMVIYDHHMFPARYHGALFMGDWTRGQIRAVRLKPYGGTYQAKASVFVEGHPLNITDLEVGPDGWLYFCTGGRGSEGGIYRVTWTGNVPPEKRVRGEGIDIAMRQPQIHSAFARQQIATTKNKLGDAWADDLLKIVRDKDETVARRLRALDIMQWFGPAPEANMLLELTEDTTPRIRAKAVYLLGVQPSNDAGDRLSQLLEDREPLVQRAVCETLARGKYNKPLDKLVLLLASTDRTVSWAAAKTLQTIPTDQWRHKVFTSQYERVALLGTTALLSADPDKKTCLAALKRMDQVMAGFVTDANFIIVLRNCQLALAHGQLEPSETDALKQRMAHEFPSGNATINRELIRILARLKATEASGRILAYLNDKADTKEKIHLAVHAPHFVAGWSSADRLKMLEQIVALREEATNSNQSKYLDVASRNFVSNMPENERLAVLGQAERWPQAAIGAIAKLPKSLDEATLQQIKAIDQKLKEQDDEDSKKLRTGIVAVLSRSQQPEAMTYLTDLFENEPERRGIVAMGLAQMPGEESWPYLIRSLKIVEGNAVQDVIVALTKIDRRPKSPSIIRDVLLIGLKQKNDKPRQQTIALLKHWTGQSVGAPDASPEQTLAAWQVWFAGEYPDHPEAKLPIASKNDRYQYDQLLNLLTDDEAHKANPKNGAIVYRKAQCAKCHRYGESGEGIGPDLTTVSRRLQVKEILESVVYPSHAISDRYNTKVVHTTQGKSYTGVVLRDPDTSDLIVMDSTGQETKVANSDVDDIVPSRVSSMPAGLLNTLETNEIADLFAYLREPPPVIVTRRPE